MKVRELIKLLLQQNQDSEVIMSKDAEGNNFSPFSDLNSGKYEPNSTWSGQYLSDCWDKNEDPEDWGIYQESDGVKSVCLWPVN